MDNFQNIFYLVCFAVFFVINVLSLYFFARLHKIQHDDFYDLWVADGKPHVPPFWFSKDSLYNRDKKVYPYNQKTFFTWLFREPDWMKESGQAHRMLWLFRLSFAVFVLTFLLVVVGFIVSQ